MSFDELASALNARSQEEINSIPDHEKIRDYFETHHPRHLTPQNIAQILDVDITKKPDASKAEQRAIAERRLDFKQRIDDLVSSGALKKIGDSLYGDPANDNASLANNNKASGLFPNSDGANEELIGVVHQFNGHAMFEPLDGDLDPVKIKLDRDITNGSIVTAKISADFGQASEIIKVHGNMNDDNALGKISALSAGIPMDFPDDIMDGVDLSVPDVSDRRFKDFTNEPFITIDPNDARDYDDAICVRRKNGGWVVKVAVADVSHYVQPGTKLFKEAVKRGNSTYLPDGVIPMLPEELSNGVCSLKPHENRAAIVCTMEIDSEGHISKPVFERGIINSRARLTYDQVQAAIEGDRKQLHQADKKHGRQLWGYIAPALEACNARLRDKKRRGALEINAAEQRVSIGRSRDVSLALEVGNESHNIIEELMIAANVCAVEALEGPILRVHGTPRPDVLNEFSDPLKDLGIHVPKNGDMKARMQNIAYQIPHCEDPDEGYTLLTRMQSMARYTTEEGEHWGLGLKKYGHKTSPIRRIADLITDYDLNQQLGMAGAAKPDRWIAENKEQIAEHASMTERRSQRAEMECKNRMTALWVKRNLSSEFEARVTRVNGKKLWVSVEQEGVEIKTAISRKSLPKDLREYSAGDKLIVTPTKANHITGIIEFSPSTPGVQATATAPQRPSLAS